jgi:hypothetical protein
MATRTVKILGWGTGTASITALLDGETVFSGNVDLIALTDDNSSVKTAPTLFTFDIPIETTGKKPIKITVGSAPVRFGPIVANYTEVDWGGSIYYTGEFEFADIAPEGPGGTRDPREQVRVNGVLQTPDRQGLTGTWHWIIDPGSIIEHDLVIKEGFDLEF